MKIQYRDSVNKCKTCTDPTCTGTMWTKPFQNKSLCTTFVMEISLICMIINLQLTLISITNVVHQDSFWNIGNSEMTGLYYVSCDRPQWVRLATSLLVKSWESSCFTSHIICVIINDDWIRLTHGSGGFNEACAKMAYFPKIPQSRPQSSSLLRSSEGLGSKMHISYTIPLKKGGKIH